MLVLFMLGVAWRYYAIESRITEWEAQEARLTVRAPATRQSVAPSVAKLDPSLPWRHPGLCVGGAGDRADKLRARYLATFVPTPAWHTSLLVHPQVPATAVADIKDHLELLNAYAARQIGLPASPPFIYVYPTVAALREHSCAGVQAVAYYDGAIHLALESESGAELYQNLRHEYAHHVLVSNGIDGPFWFQEGTAMALAGDAPSDSYILWHEHPIDVADMVRGFPHTAPLEVATAYYANAYVMMEFLDRICPAGVECRPAELAEALISESATPETLFEWATAQHGDLAPAAARKLWDDYVAGRKIPATYQTLLERAQPTRAGSDG